MGTDRVEYIKGLRALADILEQHDEMPLPYAAGTGNTPSERITFYYLSGKDAKAALRTAARILPGPLDKAQDDDTFRLVGKVHGLHFQAVAYRSTVCKRVVTGTKKITTKIPDPHARPAPLIEVTHEVETVEWVCEPLLAEATS